MKTLKIFKLRRDRFYLGELCKEEKHNYICLFPSIFIEEGDIVLILDEETQKDYYKFLVLTGKHTGKISWEDKSYFNIKELRFEEIEVT